ncbi:hypothetical protein [Micromonospora tulbaghiae]|uniref:hypothetical protein n=1 Tax=Micromonospora tulbaghiae TaxID=479978 RepID=UPI0013C50B95|nr:hypothetical protein [Micromonospora tulbaghiae]
MLHQSPASTFGCAIAAGHLYLVAAAVGLTASIVMWATGREQTIVTDLLVAMAAVGVLGWRHHSSDDQRRREEQAMRAELLHFGEVIELMARDMEAADLRAQDAVERARQQGAAEAAAAASAERQRLVERHRTELEATRRRAEARGFVSGARQRLGGGGQGFAPRVVRDQNARPY